MKKVKLLIKKLIENVLSIIFLMILPALFVVFLFFLGTILMPVIYYVIALIFCWLYKDITLKESHKMNRDLLMDAFSSQPEWMYKKNNNV